MTTGSNKNQVTLSNDQREDIIYGLKVLAYHLLAQINHENTVRYWTLDTIMNFYPASEPGWISVTVEIQNPFIWPKSIDFTFHPDVCAEFGRLMGSYRYQNIGDQ